MIHRPAPSQPRPARRGTPRIPRPLTALGGLAVFLTAAIGLAPAASAALPPPEPPAVPVPPPPPPPTVSAQFPPWAIVAMVAATVVLAVATTLVTLALEHLRQARRTAAATPEPQTGEPPPSTAPQPEARQGEILSSHHYAAGHGRYRADSH